MFLSRCLLCMCTYVYVCVRLPGVEEGTSSFFPIKYSQGMLKSIASDNRVLLVWLVTKSGGPVSADRKGRIRRVNGPLKPVAPCRWCSSVRSDRPSWRRILWLQTTMRVHVYIYIYMCVCVCVCVYMCECMIIHIYIYIYIYVCARRYVEILWLVFGGSFKQEVMGPELLVWHPSWRPNLWCKTYDPRIYQSSCFCWSLG